MNAMKKTAALLDDMKIHVKIKIAGLWASVMFCYIYGDYFGLYQPGALKDMLAGKMGPFGPTTQGILLGTSAIMAVPSVMVFLSLAVKPNLNRRLNIIFGAIYTLIIPITMWGWAFSILLGVVEVILTALIVWYALNWPHAQQTT